MGHTVNQSKRKSACNASRLPFVVEWHPYEAAATEQKNCSAAAFGRTHRRNPFRKTCEGSRVNSVYNQYKRIVASIGLPQARFHDLRHSYAVAAIQSGDDIKTVQGNLGHATASFTLDVYGHVTDQMKQNSAARMEKFIEKVSGE